MGAERGGGTKDEVVGVLERMGDSVIWGIETLAALALLLPFADFGDFGDLGEEVVWSAL